MKEVIEQPRIDYHHAEHNSQLEVEKLRQWVEGEIRRTDSIINPAADGCHCKEDCGAWYNLD